MPLQIPKSQIDRLGFDFAPAVEAYRQAKLAHRMTQHLPAPVAHPLVERVVTRKPVEGQPDDFVADYEIVDDTPVLTLAQRKQELMNAVTREEVALIGSILPPGKRRLRSMEHARLSLKPSTQCTIDELRKLNTWKLDDQQMETISYHAATLHAEIEDLTEATIGGWVPAAFPA